MTKNKSWTLTPTHTLALALPNRRGECVKCHAEKDIWLRADTDYETRSSERASVAGGKIHWLCWSCSNDVVYKLEISTYPVKNKEQIVKELREALKYKPDENDRHQENNLKTYVN